MKILSIETSCDETAIAILEANGGLENPKFKVLASTINSQIDIHKEYGGVFPALAKREHTKNLIPVLEETLEKANLEASLPSGDVAEVLKEITTILEREPEMLKEFIDFIFGTKIPNIDTIAVTQGPGLAPALWVGLNFAKALALAWNKPLIPINHMEGHILSVLINEEALEVVEFPAIALLISGGHTQLVLVKNWMDYEIIGQTKDDAVGEAFDKVARMLGLPYPGGPEISKLADETRKNPYETKWNLPRPMLHTKDFDFSFSGLKTAVLYTIQKIKKEKLAHETRQEIAREFEDAVVEVLIKKTKKALQKYNAKTLIIGGGVSANKEIRKDFEEMTKSETIKLLLPSKELSTDNAIMIAIAGYFRFMKKAEVIPIQSIGNSSALNEIKADGNLSL